MTKSSINNNISLEIENLLVVDALMCTPENYSKFVTQENQDLNIIQTNIRSINKNFDQFNIILSITKACYDIIVMTECQIKDSKYIPALQGYTFYHTKNNPLQNDGVVLYVKNNLAGKLVEPDFYDDQIIKLSNVYRKQYSNYFCLSLPILYGLEILSSLK